MYKIQLLNNISPLGLEIFDKEKYKVESDLSNPDAYLVRSFNMLTYDLPQNTLAIARAGVGVNNIPVDKCTEKGIVVFNTPGANANSVKELVLTGLFLSSRKIIQGINWLNTTTDFGPDFNKSVEKEKSKFVGPEIKNKTLGIIGIGAIGTLVANDAINLGMKVIGYDPFISVESAWGLNMNVQRSKNIDELLRVSDYISLNLPLSDTTRGIINKDKFTKMKKGIKILNFARNELVNNGDLISAIKDNIVSAYVTDFPEKELLKYEQIICIPHLGASTPEAENNCAVMAAEQLKGFLEFGNIKNSVNFPNCEMYPNGKTRILIINKNIPNMIGQITTCLANENININNMLNQHKDSIAYNIIDIDQLNNESIIKKINEIDGVISTRCINFA